MIPTYETAAGESGGSEAMPENPGMASTAMRQLGEG